MKIYPKTLYDALDHDIPLFKKAVEALGIEIIYCDWYHGSNEETREAYERLEGLRETHDIYEPIFIGGRRELYLAIPKDSDIDLYHAVFRGEKINKIEEIFGVEVM